MTGHVHPSAAPQAPPATPAFKLVASVTLAGALAGALVAYVYQTTLPAIQRYAAGRIEGAVSAVLGAPARLDTLYLSGDTLSASRAAGAAASVPMLFVGRDATGRRTGVAVEAAAPGFADEIRLMVGFDPADTTLLGYVVLGQKETPGLGDKIEKDSAFNAALRGRVAPLSGSRNATSDPHQVQTITGATISSRAVVRIINDAVARWQPRIAAYDRSHP